MATPYVKSDGPNYRVEFGLPLGGIALVVPQNSASSSTFTLPPSTSTLAASASALTSGRVPFATATGLLADSANLTFAPGTGLIVADGVNAQTIRITGKAVTANGSSGTFTYPANTSFQRITTTTASLAITLPATSASVDGLVIVFEANAGVATASWVAGAGGAAIVGAPAALSANVPVRMLYNHSDTSWYPF